MSAPHVEGGGRPQGASQAVAIGVMLLAVGVALAIGRLSSTSLAADTAAWRQEIETGADHIEPRELASELLAARGDLALVDLRPAAEYAAYHLPGAVNLTVPQVCGEAGARLFAAGPRLVVLYSNGPAHPGQAWVELRRQGRANVRVLAGGLDDFKAQVLTPPSLRAGTDEARSRAEQPAYALQRAFFLGDPRANPLATWAADPAQLTQPTMVSPQWLQARLGAVAVIDVRSRPEDFAAGHVPGAVHLPVATLRVKSGETLLFLAADDVLAAQFGALGIARTTPVVICAADRMQDATLTAVALLRLGHRALAILEGGVLRWATERRPLTSAVTVPTPATYEPKPSPELSIAIDELAQRVQQGGTAILDVRPPDFFRGEKSTEARPGHIPGAVNRPYSKDLVGTDDGQWLRTRAELEAEYAALGLAKDEAVVVHCRTGHTASASFFVMRYLLGYEKARWYNGSWTEWAEHQELPAVTGDK